MPVERQPLVTAIVPAYNAEPFIRETLESILSQTYKEIEVVVVDDGSNDGTARIVEEIAAGEPRVRFFQQHNRGVAAARNLAIHHARGEYIAPIDADDVWYPSKIEKQVRRLEEYPEAGCAYTWSVSIDEKGRLMDAGPRWDLEGEVFQPLVLRNFIGNASVPIFRASALKQVGGYDESLRAAAAQGCEDWELCLRVAEHFDYCVVQDYLVGYRCYSQSMSYNHEAMGRSYAIVMDRVRQQHPEIPEKVYRWSQSLFYLYLTNKSNVSGDLRGSWKWLLKAIHEDPAVLTLSWVRRCFISRALRKIAYACTRNPRVWGPLRPSLQTSVSYMTFEQILEEAQRRDNPASLFEKIQAERWALTTNHRSCHC